MSDSDKEYLFKKLDQILREMVIYSFTLGDWGKYVWVEIHLGDNGYTASSFGVKPSEIRRFENQKSCNSCFEDIYPCLEYIYLSKYDYANYSYDIDFNPDIRELSENMWEVKNMIWNIETLAIDIYNIVVNSYLDQSKKYKKILIHFRRDVTDYNKIIEEIKESTIFGRSISENYKFRDQPVFTFTALKEKKRGTNNDEIELSYPDYYTFSFMVYR